MFNNLKKSEFKNYEEAISGSLSILTDKIREVEAEVNVLTLLKAEVLQAVNDIRREVHGTQAALYSLLDRLQCDLCLNEATGKPEVKSRQ